ncbi:peptidase M16 domain protein [Gloeothece citriformis PCC 7424]|uniref:Peptidase M16 domain protein n=1 Tax=Gloeothece citriformis (strain PCC 7424) TaxID=65393 RepID=B7KGS5_GLOC7|nr:peptidase M16 domain protein [Gloeothece citriformis PCC 7424]
MQLKERRNVTQFPASVSKLNHGLTVIHQYIPATPVVVADIWVKAGASAEPPQWQGMAHFLEHMIFKGSRQIKPGMFDEAIENLGGVTNAATSHDYAHFFLTTATAYLSESLPYLAEILLQAAIPDQEFYRERDVVLEELRYSYDDPDWVGFQVLCESLYQYHPYGKSVLGDEEHLLSHTPNQMRCFHGTYYQPQNMTVVIVGGVKEDQALSLVEQSFSQFNVPSECPSSLIEAEPPLIETRRNLLYVPRLESSRLMMGWIGPGVDNLEDAVGLDLLSVLLGGGRCSRLVRELREDKQLVHHIDSSFSLQRDSSLFTINGIMGGENLERVENIICNRLHQLQTTPLTQEELVRCQRLLCHDYIFSTETPGQLAGLYGYYQTIADQAELSLFYPKIIQQLTPIDLQRLANQYLCPERYAITIMQPC